MTKTAPFTPILTANLTCPVCAHVEQQMAIPTDMCLFFHTCAACGTRLRPEPGDCCVFCSYGDQLCVPRQAEAWSGASEQ